MTSEKCDTSRDGRCNFVGEGHWEVLMSRSSSTLIRLPANVSDPPSKIMLNIPREERLIGVRSNGEIVTEIAGKRVIRMWKR